MLDDLSDLFGFVVLLASMIVVSSTQGCLLYIYFDGIASPAAQKLYCVQGKASTSEHLCPGYPTNVFTESL